jgi:hypothetical protein
VLKSVARIPGGDFGPAVELDNVKPALVTGCLAPAGTGTFLRTAGIDKGDLALEANHLRLAKNPWEVG